MARIYVASSWRNEQQPGICVLLKVWGHDVYDFRNPPGKSEFRWSDIESGWQDWDAVRYRNLLTTNPIASHGFIADLRGMMWADTCVLVLPCGRSAHLEAGWFAGANKRLVILMLQKEEPDLMYLFAHKICIDLCELKDELK